MAVSFEGSKGFTGALSYGAPIKTAVGYNTTAGTNVFAARSTYEPVPGGLSCTLQPTSANSLVIVRAHLFWGGWYNRSSVDVAVGFRVYKNLGDGSPWQVHGDIFPNKEIPGYTTLSTSFGVHTGCYKYNQGDTNSSADRDEILVVGPAGSTNPITFAIWWGCLYDAGSRTLYWNRTINTGNSYNPTHTCTISATEIKQF